MIFPNLFYIILIWIQPFNLNIDGGVCSVCGDLVEYDGLHSSPLSLTLNNKHKTHPTFIILRRSEILTVRGSGIFKTP